MRPERNEVTVHYAKWPFDNIQDCTIRKNRMPKLAGQNLLDQIGPDAAAKLAELGQRRNYGDGETIHFRGDRDLSMCIVISGCVRMVRQRANGRRTFISLIVPGQHIADVLMFGSNAVRTHDAVAAGEVQIDHYDSAAFAKLLGKPEIVLALYRITAGRLVGAMTMIDDLRSMSREAHLVKLLLHMRPRDGGDAIECLQEDLAALLGVSQMTLAKTLAVLRREGLVETGYRQVRLIDVERMRTWLASRAQE